MARKHNYHISQKTSNIILLAIPSLFIIIGIITIISTSITVANRNEFIKTAESCYSYVDYVHTYTTTSYTGTGKHRHRTTTTHYDAYVHYTVNGVTYSNMEIPGTTYRKIGDEIKIYYDPENPQTFITEPNVDEDIVFYLFACMSIIFGGIVLFAIIIAIRKQKRKLKGIVNTPAIPYPQNNTIDTYNDYNSDNNTADIYTDYNNTQPNYLENNSPFYSDNDDQSGSNQKSPFDTYLTDNASSSYDYNSTITSDSYSNITSPTDNQTNQDLQRKSPFEKYN